MCKAMEEMRKEAVHEHAVRIVKALLAIGKLTYEEIATSSGLTVDEVKALDEQRSA